MAGRLLTTQSAMQCPHGGQVQAISSNTKVSVGSGAFVLRVNDTFIISGCPFQIPAPSGTIPSLVRNRAVACAGHLHQG